jgi:hypothetical protein
VDTVLICDASNTCITEFAALDGTFRRIIVVEDVVVSATYSCRSDIIAAHCRSVISHLDFIVVLCYETGAELRRVANLTDMRAIGFTANGAHLLVTESLLHRVSKFAVVAGNDYQPFAATRPRNGLLHPKLVVPDEGGGVVVVGLSENCEEAVLVDVDASGVTRRSYLLGLISRGDGVTGLARVGDEVWVRRKLDNSHPLVLRGEWGQSLRCAWVTACVGRK